MSAPIFIRKLIEVGENREKAEKGPKLGKVGRKIREYIHLPKLAF